MVTCNPNGSYTYTFAVTNLTDFIATVAEFHAVSPSTVAISPNPVPLTPPLLPNATRQITVTIGPGVPAGTNICFTLGIRDTDGFNCCTGARHCITLGDCPAVQTACASGVCCGGAPHIDDPAFAPFLGKRLAVATEAATIPCPPGYPAIQCDAVVQIVDLTETTSWVPNSPNITPPMYHGPAGHEWTHANLGTVFGITLDRLGNIFLTSTSAYNGDFYPATGTYPSGTIWRLDAGTGIPSVYAQLPNFSDPALVAIFPNNLNETYPALGDISYDCAFDQLFVTNLEDGKIYRLRGTSSNNLTGSVASTFDPFQPDNGSPGFAPLGERLVAVKAHNHRVYYSVWKEDCGNIGGPTDFNEIWSVGLDPTGDFVPSDNRLELKVPHMNPAGGQDFSNPVFDISFSRDGNMLLAERTMHCDPASNQRTPPNAKCYTATVPAYAAATLAAAHASRVLEYSCKGDAGPWTLTPSFVFPGTGHLPYTFNVGNLVNDPLQCPLALPFQPANAAGGIDYDYSVGPKYTVFSTGDALLPFTGLVPYGLQGFPPTGGGMAAQNGPVLDAIAIDLNGIVGLGLTADKSQIGDVEIVCPPAAAP